MKNLGTTRKQAVWMPSEQNRSARMRVAINLLPEDPEEPLRRSLVLDPGDS